MTPFLIRPLTWVRVGRTYTRARGVGQYSYGIRQKPTGVTLTVWYGSEPVAEAKGPDLTVEEAKQKADEHHAEKVKKHLIPMVPEVHDCYTVDLTREQVEKLLRSSR